MRALHTAATGMIAQELNVQVISNNIANMRTTGYKRQRAEFEDLLYEHVRRIGTQTSTQGNILPVGVDLGSGTPQDGLAQTDGMGDIQQGNLEQSNVEPVKEIADLIASQRAYEMNSKVISATDQMLQSVIGLYR